MNIDAGGYAETKLCVAWEGDSMRRFLAEAAGNTFLVLYFEENSAEPLMYLQTLRQTHRWDFDSALLMHMHEEHCHVHVIEQDGSRSKSGGNGLRAAAWVLDHLGKERKVFVDGKGLRIRCVSSNGNSAVYRVPMGNARLGVNVHVPGIAQPAPLYLIQDEPHVVIQVPCIALDELTEIGRRIPWANCTMVTWRRQASKLHALTYERGLCRIPQSSGTGACAAVQACRASGIPLDNEVTVHMLGDEPLVVAGDTSGLVLQGSVRVAEIESIELASRGIFDWGD